MNRQKQGLDARTCATRVLQQVLGKHHSLSSVLPVFLSRLSDPAQRAYTQQLCYGVLRWQPQLELVLEQLVKRPLRSKDIDVHSLLLLGLYQILHLNTAAHAAVSETVSVTRHLNKTWASSLVNAVLRNLLRNREELLRSCADNQIFVTAHPEWLIGMLQKAWPDDWENILANNNQQAPMWLRVNQRLTTPQDYLLKLGEAGLQAEITGSDSALLLGQPCDVLQLPGFEQGEVSVQDGAAQLAAGFLDLQAGQRVLDACAAPGGKTAHILEAEPALAQLVALDRDTDRLDRVEENLERLGLSAQVIAADAAKVEDWWDKIPFDRILLDAPCSGSGVIRRHPDIKALRRSSDIEQTAKQQQQLLESLWPLLMTGGKLLYATCSILPQENSCQVENFIANNADARLVPIGPEHRNEHRPGLQILPGEDSMDGFYYACLQKT